MLRLSNAYLAIWPKIEKPVHKALPQPIYMGLHAIVVEDDAETRKLCCSLLEKQGFSVHAVDRGVAALTAVRQHRPNLILMDLQLRDVSGFEAVSWLRSDPALRTVPVIAITALAFSADDPILSEAGIDALVRKPVSTAALARTIHDVLG